MEKRYYHSLKECLALIKEPNFSASMHFLKAEEAVIRFAKGSSSKHQAWKGGYLDHVTEVMNIGMLFYEALGKVRKLPFTLDDALVSIFLHDVEKPWKQLGKSDKSFFDAVGKKNTAAIDVFRREVIKKYGFRISAKQWNAIKYADGEGDDYDPHRRVQKPLAAFVHCCDTTSARVWPNYPLRDNDPWANAARLQFPL